MVVLGVVWVESCFVVVVLLLLLLLQLGGVLALCN